MPTDSAGNVALDDAAQGFTVALVLGREIVKMSPDAAREVGQKFVALADQAARANVTHANQLRMSTDDQGEMPV